MKAFVAERNYDYEGFTIIGVFSTRDAAQKACDNDRDETGRLNGDSHEVEEFDFISV